MKKTFKKKILLLGGLILLIVGLVLVMIVGPMINAENSEIAKSSATTYESAKIISNNNNLELATTMLGFAMLAMSIPIVIAGFFIKRDK